MINNDLKKVSKYLGEQGHEELSQFLTTHMCRRTGATFMLIAGGTAEEIKFAGKSISFLFLCSSVIFGQLINFSIATISVISVFRVNLVTFFQLEIFVVV